MMKKILVTGCNGQLGRAIRQEYQGITHTVMGNIPYDEIMKIAEGIS